MSTALVVSGTDTLALTRLLIGVGITSVEVATSAIEATNVLNSLDVDFVLVNSPLGDNDAESFAEYAADNTLAATVFISSSKTDAHALARLQTKGVLCMRKPLNPETVRASIIYISAMRSDLQHVRDENAALKAKLAEERLVDRAKLLLVQYLGMSEQAAHKHIEKKSMDQRVTRSVVAKEIIKTYES